MDSKTIFLIYFIFVTVLGACIGSFLNVVIFRLPEGLSLTKPPSHCPKCKYHLAWYDNIPIVSWFVLDAKCRNCGAKISSQYPVIEGVTALLFLLLFVLYFTGASYHMMEFYGPESTWPVYLTHMILIAALIAATMIDARLFIIPMELPWAIGVTAAILLPFATGVKAENFHLVPTVSGHAVGIALGGGIGVAIAWFLLEKKIIPRSFEFNDEGQWVIDGKPAGPAFGPAPTKTPAEVRLDGTSLPHPSAESPAPDAPVASNAQATDAPAATEAAAPVDAPPKPAAEELPYELGLPHPNPRGEMAKELMFLAIPLLGAIMGYFIVPSSGPEGRITDALGFEHVLRLSGGWTNLMMWQHVLAGVVFGGLIGGGVAWFFRIAGTYLFGKEAMGMGDVHILAAIGAVIGAPYAIFVFFFAAVLGLVGAIITGAANNLFTDKFKRPIPFGPYLALATVILLLIHDPVEGFVTNVGNTVGALFMIKG